MSILGIILLILLVGLLLYFLNRIDYKTPFIRNVVYGSLAVITLLVILSMIGFQNLGLNTAHPFRN